MPPATLSVLDAADIEGLWYVVDSNYRYWSKKERNRPRFEYTRRPNPNGELVLFDDHVTFFQGDREKEFLGVDIQDPELPGHFQWRGDGALYGVVNQWFVVGIDKEAGWMVIYFPPSSLGTAPGLEIITREQHPSDEVLAAARQHIAADADLSERAKGMHLIAQDAPK